MNYAPRILLIVCLVVGGFFLWWLWLGAALCAFLVYADVGPRQHGVADGRFPKLEEHDDDWLQKVRDCTESPAEIAFLDLMVEAYSLQPRGRSLQGENIVVRMQVEAIRYRLDFLIDECLAVEIDGAEWHSSPEAQARDRHRDAALAESGYVILRIPAKTVLYDRASALKMVQEARPKAAEAHRHEKQERMRALRSGMNPINVVKEANIQVTKLANVMEDISKKTEEYRAREITREHDPNEIRAILLDQERMMVAIETMIAPDSESEAVIMTAENAKEVSSRLAEFRDPSKRPLTLSEAKTRLKVLKSMLELQSELRKLQNELDADERLREIYNSLDDEFSSFKANNDPARHSSV